MNNKLKGFLLAAGGASFWGASGAAAQYLFDDTPVTATWLVGVRMLAAGIILTIVALTRIPGQVKQILTTKRDVGMLITFALFGVLNSQLTYFLAIKYSNASTATVLQYLQPVIIILWLAISQRRWPRRIDDISVVIAVCGTALLVTGGHLGSLTLTPLALFWGLWTAGAAALYTLMPRQLLRRYDTLVVSGLGMTLGGLAMLPVLLIHPQPHLNGTGWLMVGCVVIFGTLLAYTMFLGSLNYLSPATSGILGAFEPLIATVLAVTLLGTKLTWAMVVGSILILTTTFLQALPVKENPMADELEE